MAKSVLVIMPFGKEFDSVFSKIIKPPLVELGYSVERADSLKDRQNIIKKIMIGMYKADIIIADLTTNNANAFYELGICHSKLKNVIMITQDLSSVPFDLRQYVLDSYSRDIDDVEKFATTLKQLIEGMQGEGIIFENPVTDFWPDDKITVLEKSDVSIPSKKVDSENNQEANYEDGLIDVRMTWIIAPKL